MTARPLSRRDFLKLWGLVLGALALPVAPVKAAPHPPPANEDPYLHPRLARVAARSVPIYRAPDFASEKTGEFNRDRIVRIQEEIRLPAAPGQNGRWYRLASGFMHSANLQRVDGAHLNPVLTGIPEGGQLGEVTVPFTQSYRRAAGQGWTPFYRLYYGAVFWITSLEEGPDGKPWYRLTDDRTRAQYDIPARYMRPIPAEELAPLSPEVPPEEKRIEVSIQTQTLSAYEGERSVFQRLVSTGMPAYNPPGGKILTSTPAGRFFVQLKRPSRHMNDGRPKNDLLAEELFGVPWVALFTATMIGFHGAYWHDNFGSVMSHGCINMRMPDAKWLYRWCDPQARPQDWTRMGMGTLVIVRADSF